MTEQEQKAAMLGITHAWQVMFRAMVAAHPDPAALRDAIRREHESSMAALLPRAYPEVAMDAFQEMLLTVLPKGWIDVPGRAPSIPK